MMNNFHRITFIYGFSLALILGLISCSPFFANGAFPHLELYFKLNQAISKGDTSLIHTWSFPGLVKVKKKWIRVSGSLVAAGGNDLPNKVQIVGEVSEINTGRVLQRIKMTVKIKTDGSFEASKKLAKDIKANSLLSVTATPDSASIPKNSQITLCIDLLKKKADTNSVPSCAGGGEVASFTSIEGFILGPNCAVSGCHTGANPPHGLNMSAGQAYDNLVNVASREQPSLMRVKPGDAEASYIVRKIRGDASISGGRMPLGQPALSQEEINQIISWINNGAKDN